MKVSILLPYFFDPPNLPNMLLTGEKWWTFKKLWRSKLIAALDAVEHRMDFLCFTSIDDVNKARVSYIARGYVSCAYFPILINHTIRWDGIQPPGIALLRILWTLDEREDRIGCLLEISFLSEWLQWLLLPGQQQSRRMEMCATIDTPLPPFEVNRLFMCRSGP